MTGPHPRDARSSARHGAATGDDRATRDMVPFTFEGRRLTARAGDSVAAALLANGVRILGRSWKYHRPRGYRCGRGHCSSCAMRVDGLPGVLTCVTPLRAGMVVEREHAWPSAEADLLRAADALSPLMPPGFYYRRFRRSPRLYEVFERALAGVAGQGRPPDPEAARRLAVTTCERRDDLDVLVVGGGVAGMSAALAAADEGATVLLVEKDDELGGRLAGVASRETASSDTPASGLGAGVVRARTLAERTVADERIDVLSGAEAVAWYDEGVIAVDRRPDLLLVRPATVVLATGGYDRGLPFPGWDLAGVMFASAALRLVDRYGVSPGSRAVVITRDDLGHAMAARLREVSVEIACVADLRPSHAVLQDLAAEAASGGAVFVADARGARAHGIRGISALTVATGPGEGRVSRFDCDLVCISAGTRPADDLAYQATCAGSLVLGAGPRAAGQAVTPGATGAPALWVAGLAAGACDPNGAAKQAESSGVAAARQARAAARPSRGTP